MKLGDASGSALLKDPGCLRQQCELLYEHLVEQKVNRWGQTLDRYPIRKYPHPSPSARPTRYPHEKI